MSHKTQDSLHEFDHLIQQLSHPDNRPDVKRLSPGDKRAMRQKLLAQYDEQTLSRQATWTLWRFAGSVAGVMLLATVVIGFWMAISQSTTDSQSEPVPAATETLVESATAAPQSTDVPHPTITPSPNQTLTTLPAELGDSFRLLDYSLFPQPFQPGQPLQVTLLWQTTGRPSANYTAFVHLLDADGNLVAQADQSLGESTTFVNGTRPTTELTLWLPDTLTPGTLTLTTGLYDSSTGLRLMPNGENALNLAQIEVSTESSDAEVAVIHRAVVSGTSGVGLTLRDTPEGQPIAVLDEGSIVLLADWPRVESDGFLWQPVETIDGIFGWVAAEFLTYPADYPRREIVPAPFPPEDRVWVIKAVQNGRSAADAPITFDITLGVELVSTDEAVLKLGYAEPDWATQTEGRLPVDGLGEDHVIRAGLQTVTVTAVINPAELAAIINTQTPVLATQLGTFTTDANSIQRFDIMMFSTFTNVQFDLQSPDMIGYEFWDQGIVRFISATQKERLTAVTTFEVTLELQLTDPLMMGLYLVNPDWDFGRPLTGAYQLTPSSGNSYFVTATPAQIRETTGTDTPIVAAIVELLDNPGGTAIIELFTECPVDLTRSDEFTCSP